MQPARAVEDRARGHGPEVLQRVLSWRGLLRIMWPPRRRVVGAGRCDGAPELRVGRLLAGEADPHWSYLQGTDSARDVFDFEVQKCTRRCAKTDRELQPGEVFYSVLVSEGADVVRRDFAQEAWKGPPDEAIGWWKSKVPDPRAQALHWAPNDVLVHFFVELEGREDRRDTRYILALLMIRRRVLRLEATQTDPQGCQQLVVYCPRNETEYRVPVTLPSTERIEQIQTELAGLLQANVSEGRGAGPPGSCRIP